MKLAWQEYGLSFEQLGDEILVTDLKVSDISNEGNCYLVRGWNLNNQLHVEELKSFIETCCGRGFRWVLQEGHPMPTKRGREGETRRYLALSRAYTPQPAWDVAVDNPGGATYAIQKRHAARLDIAKIPYQLQSGGGRNLKIARELLTEALDAIANLPGEESDAAENQKEQELKSDSSIPEKDKEALIRARRGQGLFRQRVLAIEPYCRLTGVSDPRFLRASHIKPWAQSTNQECLDGNNGLMLSPHADHLFDQGYISFEQSGRVLIKDGIAEILRDWSLGEKTLGKPFTDAQDVYLAYHRSVVFARKN